MGDSELPTAKYNTSLPIQGIQRSPFIKWFPERRVVPLNRTFSPIKLSGIRGGADLTALRPYAMPLIGSSKITKMMNATLGIFCYIQNKKYTNIISKSFKSFQYDIPYR